MERIVGYVDGFTDGVLRGWLANLDDPNALELFVLRDQDGRELEFSTCHHRLDVSRIYDKPGLFGFAIKRDWLDERSRSVTAFDRRGAVIAGGRGVAVPDLAQGRRKSAGPLDFFLHLAKTAGTSVRSAVMGSADEAETLLIYQEPNFGLPEHMIATIPLYQRQCLRLAIGHCSFGVHEQLGVPTRYSIFIRDPASRLRSNYIHHATQRSVFAWDPDGRPVHAAAAVNEGLSDEFDNLMVRVVAGLTPATRPPGCVSQADVELALHNIREHFKFVGVYETLAKSFAELCQSFGFGVPALPELNISSKMWPGAKQHLAAVQWDAVFDRNRYDFALYKAILESGLVGRLA